MNVWDELATLALIAAAGAVLLIVAGARRLATMHH